MSIYKDTLNLPQSTLQFNTIASGEIHKLEADTLKQWGERLYSYQFDLQKHKALPQFTVHDGPPFANGDIHLGHLINKTLKDMINRSRRLMGFSGTFTPGWDCHGLPIENAVKDASETHAASPASFRADCMLFAADWVRVQNGQFQRLGVSADWNNPYLTMNPGYEANVVEVFATLVKQGLVYRRNRPVHWSMQNQSALAEAEIEYKMISHESAYVAFQVSNIDNLSLLVWTTTPWTLPANLAIAVSDKIGYSVVTWNNHRYVVASALAASALPDHKFEYFISADNLQTLRYRPLFEKNDCGVITYQVVPSDHVSDKSGTGLVHIAPGHGDDDYHVGLTYGLEVYCPVKADGSYDNTVYEPLRGMNIWKADKQIVAMLTENFNRSEGKHGVAYTKTIQHDYPHDWRSGKPTLTRATPQWFINLDQPFNDGNSLRQRAIEACEKITFVPSYGKDRLLSMLRSRPDWCISRQRQWGIPIPVAYNQNGEAILSVGRIKSVADAFRVHGSDIWYTETAEHILNLDISNVHLTKETDIFDVWFESGCSWKTSRTYPSDVYIEGSDQHRGWFQHSLLLGLAITGEAPFKTVITHGFVVGPDGKKLSKRDKNYVTAMQEVVKYGAEPLRAWAASLDFTDDMKSSPKVIQEFTPKYDKLRNTMRFLLANLYDYRPTPPVAFSQHSLDNYIRYQAKVLRDEVIEHYRTYSFHQAWSKLFNFCTVEISAIYGNAMKDRLYCEASDSPLRRRCQAAMYEVLVLLTKLVEPIMPFTACEIWNHLGAEPDMPEMNGIWDVGMWGKLISLRDDAMIQLEMMKIEEGLKKTTDAEAVYHVGSMEFEFFTAYGVDLADLIGVGHHSVVQDDSARLWVEVRDAREKYKVCQRSWKRGPTVGTDPVYPDLSERDAEVMKKLRLDPESYNVEASQHP